MGGRTRRSRSDLRPPMALLAYAGRGAYRPDRQCRRRAEARTGFAPAHRQRLERRRARPDGAVALQLPVPVLCRRRAALLPALPALGRRLSRRAVQYRLLCTADADDGAGDGFRAGRVRSQLRRRSSLSHPSRPGRRAAEAEPASAFPHGDQSGRPFAVRFRLRGFQAGRLRPAPGHQRQGGGVSLERRLPAGPVVALVVAMGENRAIGRGGDLPWHLRSDMRYFREITMGKPVIMGRRTFRSLPRVLDGRRDIVLTRDRGFVAPDAVMAHSLEEGLAAALASAKRTGAEEIMIIGGEDVFREV